MLKTVVLLYIFVETRMHFLKISCNNVEVSFFFSFLFI